MLPLCYSIIARDCHPESMPVTARRWFTCWRFANVHPFPVVDGCEVSILPSRGPVLSLLLLMLLLQLVVLLLQCLSVLM